MVVGALIVLGVLGAVFVFFFVEFEEEYEDDLEEPAEEVDPYAWAKQAQQQQVAAAPVEATEPVAAAAPAAVSGYPGWKWDAEQNKWVPDNQ